MSKKEVEQPKIVVEMLGKFALSCGGKVLLEDEGRSRKVWNLLSYLIANYDRQIYPNELPDLLCSDERSDDPAKAVKNLVYRLRCMLSESELPEFDYILQKGGVYAWNPEIPMELDIEIFTNKWKKAKQELENEDVALKNYLKAIELYKGRFLPRLIYEEWTVTIAVQLQRIYMECIEKAFSILSKRNDLAPMVPICEKAISIDPFDGTLYCFYIESLVRLNMQKEALAAYETITSKLYNEMGVNPSKKLMELYRTILKSIKSVETDLVIIKEDLNEQGSMDGTYCTEYEIFKDIYRFTARGVARTGASIYIMLCTLTDQKDAIPSVEYLGKSMEKLKMVISDALRKGDLFAQYSSTQFVIMLPGTSYENGVMVGNRILSAFKKQSASKYTKLHFKLQPLDPKIL